MATDAPITGAPTRATPSSFADVHARYVAARDHFNALPDSLEATDPDTFNREEDACAKASDELDDASPGDWRELVDLMQHLVGGGSTPGRAKGDQLISHARRLLDAKPIMAAIDLYGLDRAMQRVDYIAAGADLLSDIPDLEPRFAETLRGLGMTLNEQAEAIDGILQPHRLALGKA